MYTLLRYGNRLPTVAVAQVLLNRHLTDNTLGVDGVIGKRTWAYLVEETNFSLLDAIDITDDSGESAAIRRAGGAPILVGWQCNGIGQMMLDIARSAPPGRALILLRFHGHGASGVMGVSDGFGYIRNSDKSKTYLEDEDLTSITNGNINLIAPVLKKIGTTV